MKITNIEKIDNKYHVTFKPNWLEKLFKVEKKVVKYKRKPFESYVFHSDRFVLIDEFGNKPGPTSTVCTKLSQFIHMQNF